MDCTLLRSELGNPSCEHDPCRFLLALFLYSEDLYSIVKLHVDELEKCLNCKTIKRYEFEVLQKYIDIKNPPKVLKLVDVYKGCKDWEPHPSKLCEACNGPLLTRREIVKAHDVIIVQLDIQNTSTKVRPRVNINSVPTTTLKVNNRVFQYPLCIQ